MFNKTVIFKVNSLTASQQLKVSDDSLRISDIFIFFIFTFFIDFKVKTLSRVVCFLNLNDQTLQLLSQSSLTYLDSLSLDVLSYCRYSRLCQLTLI